MRGRIMAFAVSVLGATSFIAMAARAEPTEPEKESARTLMDEGDARIASGDYVGALRAYEAADAVMRVPTTGIEVAKTLEKMGQLVDADASARRVLAYPRSALEPAAFTRARVEATVIVDRLSRRIPFMSITVPNRSPSELVVHVDGRAVAAGAAVAFDPGRHRVHVAAPGAPPVERIVDLGEGERRSVVIELEPSGPTPRPAPGPYLPPPPPPDAAPATSEPPILAWTGVGIASAGLIVGVSFGIASLSETSAIEDRCGATPCPPEERVAIDEAETLANVSNIGFGVAAAGVVLAIVGFATAGDDGPPAQGAISMPIVPRGADGPTWAFSF